MSVSVFKWACGYVDFKAKGSRPERFINLCTASGCDIWDISPFLGGISASVKASDYKKLRKHAKKSGVRLKITEKHGLPFLTHRYRFRAGMFAGPAVFCMTLALLSQFAWSMSVTGVDGEQKEQLLQVLDSFGIKKGAYINGIDRVNVTEDILMSVPSLAWMSINNEGTHISVEVSPHTDKPDILTKEPCNIVASEDGHIVDMRVFAGTAVTANGQSVLKGDLLVSGVVEYPGVGEVMKHADAEIYAEVTRSFEVPFELTREEKVYTGKKIDRKVLEFFHIRLPLYLGSLDENYDRVNSSEMLRIDGVELPVGIHTGEFYEYNNTTVTYTEQEALSSAREIAKELYLHEVSDDEILSVNDSYTVENGVLLLQTQVFCKKNIAQREKILIFGE